MKIEIKIPMLIREYDEEKDDLDEEIKFFAVIWDSEKGTLEGDNLSVDFLKWAIQNCIGEVEELPRPMSDRIIKNPLKEPEDMVYVLHRYGINLPDELQGYCYAWSLNQQYYELREFIEEGTLVF